MASSRQQDFSKYLHDGHGASGAVFAYREQVRHQSYERQPHIFGANPGQYSEGTAFGNYREPPKWWPGKQMENKLLPYTASRYCRDLVIWENGTDIPVERQGFVILGALGGQARKIIEQLGEEYTEMVLTIVVTLTRPLVSLVITQVLRSSEQFCVTSFLTTTRQSCSEQA